MIAGRIAKRSAGGLPETGELAAVEAIDEKAATQRLEQVLKAA